MRIESGTETDSGNKLGKQGALVVYGKVSGGFYQEENEISEEAVRVLIGV